MIFKSKKAFDEEVYKRISETEERERNYERMYRLEEEVNNLKHRISRLEDRFTTPQSQPYIVTPSWTGTDPVEHTPYTTTGGDTDAPTM